ncbi:hypothetical protein FCULG_00006281 [Fusarium culmorum]|uniref:Uncharacterized protein n=1 Tax=Fusarium culmorum TaxID=5516 RepID=A0A2T4GSC5_FUSCU|nr:hypothetical protein FCULG_00006281 [Fusarium culmorum]
MLEEDVFDIAYLTYWTLWQLDAGNRLDGTLTPAIRSYIFSNTDSVFRKSYIPVDLPYDLMGIAYGPSIYLKKSIRALKTETIYRNCVESELPSQIPKKSYFRKSERSISRKSMSCAALDNLYRIFIKIHRLTLDSDNTD